MFDGFFLNEVLWLCFYWRRRFYRLGCLGRFFDGSNFIGYKLGQKFWLKREFQFVTIFVMNEISWYSLYDSCKRLLCQY